LSRRLFDGRAGGIAHAGTVEIARAESGVDSQRGCRLVGCGVSGPAAHFGGRIPTTEAYRYYVEQISGSARLAPQEEAMISESLAGINDVQEFMERTSHVLSLISRNVGVTVATTGAKNALEHVYFSRLSEQKVLAVLVTRSAGAGSGAAADLSQNDLDLAARYINENFRAGRWSRCARSWRVGWSRSAANTTG